jgi:hypothetical protein
MVFVAATTIAMVDNPVWVALCALGKEVNLLL